MTWTWLNTRKTPDSTLITLVQADGGFPTIHLLRQFAKNELHHGERETLPHMVWSRLKKKGAERTDQANMSGSDIKSSIFTAWSLN
jgi:hypothetical protein